MSLLTRLRALLPSNKWCGCNKTAKDENSYQFRVKARDSPENPNRLQIREKRICQECGDETVDEIFDKTCDYDPEHDIHERKVAVDEDEMKNFGFVDPDSMVRLLTEMRLSGALSLS